MVVLNTCAWQQHEWLSSTLAHGNITNKIIQTNRVRSEQKKGEYVKSEYVKYEYVKSKPGRN